MTIRELIDALSLFEDRDMKVMIASDEEGNNFNDLTDFGVSALNPWGSPVHPSDAEDGATEVLVFWP